LRIPKQEEKQEVLSAFTTRGRFGRVWFLNPSSMVDWELRVISFDYQLLQRFTVKTLTIDTI